MDELYTNLAANSRFVDLRDATKVPPMVRQGITKFLSSKGLLPHTDDANSLESVETFFAHLGELTEYKDFFKSNSFKYLTESRDPSEVFQKILKNAEFWINRFGMEFFERHETFPSGRKTFYKETIPGTDCYLSCKGGSGVGTFSVDLALGVEKGQKQFVTGELWRLGIDTEPTSAGTAVRIIRCGGGVRDGEGRESKEVTFEGLKKNLKMHPSRALGLLALYIAYDLEASSMKTLSLEGARNKKLSLIPSSAVHFPYTAFGESLGFSPKDRNWLELPHFQERFYEVLETILGPHEVEGLDRLVKTFSALQSQGSPLTVCKADSMQEIGRVMSAYRQIHRGGRYF